MQASFDLKKSPDRVMIAGFAMLATLVVGGVSGYAVKGLTTSAALIAPAVTVSAAGLASQRRCPDRASVPLPSPQSSEGAGIAPCLPGGNYHGD